MGYTIEGEHGSFEAGSDLSASQYCGVTVNASSQLVLPAAGGQIIGILTTKPAAAGRVGAVRLIGPVERCIGGGAITAGTSVKMTAAGKILLAAATDKAIGIALETGILNDELTVVLVPHVAV